MIVYLALGSNRAPRRRRLEAALAALPGLGVAIDRVSRRLEFPPAGMHSRARFLNCVAVGHTDLPPGPLLHRLLALERAFGRRRGARAGGPAPRALDLDLIFYGRRRFRTAELRVPHPRFRARRFVLAGLADLAPTLRPPGEALTIRRLLRRAPR